MKRIFTLLLICATVCVCFVSCKEEKKTENEPAVSQSGEYSYELKETIIIGPDGKPVSSMPEYEPISEDAIVKSVEDVIGLDELLDCYESCYNGIYTVEYDRNSASKTNSEYFLVTSPAASITELKTHLEQYMISNMVEYIFEEENFWEEDSKLYYRPSQKEEIILDRQSATINYSEDNYCELSFPAFNTEGEELGEHCIEFTSTDGKFYITYITIT